MLLPKKEISFKARQYNHNALLSLHFEPEQQNTQVWLPVVQDGEQEVGAEHPLLIRPVALSTVVLQVCKYEIISQCFRSDTKLPKLT